MKKFLFVIAAVLFMAAPQISAQAVPSAVDTDGFYYERTDGGYAAAWLAEFYKVLASKLIADPDFAAIDKIIGEIWNETNVARLGKIHSSAKEVSPDFFSIKRFVEIPQSARTGFAWKLCPSTNEIPFIRVMPKNTLIGGGLNFNCGEVLRMLDHYIAKYGTAKVKQEYNELFTEAMREEGIDLRKIADSITGMAVYVEADPARMLVPGFSSASIILEVKDRSLMDLALTVAKKEKPDAVTANNELLFMTDFCPIAVFQEGKYLVITTDPVNARNVISGKAPSLKQNPDYNRYAAGTPRSGSGFFFISSELGKSVLPAYADMLIPADVKNYVDIQAVIQKLGLGSALYCMSATNANGCYSVCNTGSKALALMSGNDAVETLAYCIVPVVVRLFMSDDCGPDFDDDDPADY